MRIRLKATSKYLVIFISKIHALLTCGDLRVYVQNTSLQKGFAFASAWNCSLELSQDLINVTHRSLCNASRVTSPLLSPCRLQAEFLLSLCSQRFGQSPWGMTVCYLSWAWSFFKAAKVTLHVSIFFAFFSRIHIYLMMFCIFVLEAKLGIRHQK